MAHKSDQFYLEIVLKVNGTAIDGTEYDDVRVKIDEALYSMSDGTLTYDTETEKWLVFMSESQTQAAKSSSLAQFGVKLGNTWVYSDLARYDFKFSIIKESWNG